MSEEVSHASRVEAAIKEYEEDSDALQSAIIHGHIQPMVLAEIVSALQKQNISTLRLMLTVGEGKFVEQSIFKPVIPLLYTAAGSIITLGVAALGSRLL